MPLRTFSSCGGHIHTFIHVVHSSITTQLQLIEGSGLSSQFIIAQCMGATSTNDIHWTLPQGWVLAATYLSYVCMYNIVCTCTLACTILAQTCSVHLRISEICFCLVILQSLHRTQQVFLHSPILSILHRHSSIPQWMPNTESSMGWALTELEEISYFGTLNKEEASQGRMSQLDHNLDINSFPSPYLHITLQHMQQNMANLSDWM